MTNSHMTKCVYCATTTTDPEAEGWLELTSPNKETMGWMCPRNAYRMFQRDAEFYRKERERVEKIGDTCRQSLDEAVKWMMCSFVITQIVWAVLFTLCLPQ